MVRIGIDVDIIAALIGAHADQVPFIADDVEDLEPAQHPSQQRVRLALLAARFNGDCYVLRIGKAEAQEAVGRSAVFAFEGRDDQPGSVDPIEIVGLVAPGGQRRTAGRVTEIADVADGHVRAGELGPRQQILANLPGSIVGWPDQSGSTQPAECKDCEGRDGGSAETLHGRSMLCARPSIKLFAGWHLTQGPHLRSSVARRGS